MNAVVKPVVNEEAMSEAQQILARLEERKAQDKADRERLKKIKQAERKHNMELKSTTTKAGKVGLLVNGLGGKPQFFYKEAFLALVDDTPEAEANRAKARAWIEANTDLSERE